MPREQRATPVRVSRGQVVADAARAHLGPGAVDEVDVEAFLTAAEETQAAHTSVLRGLVQHAADTDQQLSYLMRLVHRDPYDEDAHLELVQVLRSAGRHGAAERRYRAYADRMRELGITPAGRPAPEQPAAGPASTPPGGPGVPGSRRAATRLPLTWSTEIGPAHPRLLSYRPEPPRRALTNRSA